MSEDTTCVAVVTRPLLASSHSRRSVAVAASSSGDAQQPAGRLCTLTRALR